MSSSRLLSSLKQASASFGLSSKQPKEATVPHAQPYLTGLRGVLVIQSLLWVFLQTFAPATASQTPGPTWQYVLRDIFCVPFWNQSLIYSFFIILSARTVCVPFLSNPTAVTFAGSLIGRPIRVGLSISVATAIAIVIYSQIGTEYFVAFFQLQPNAVLEAPQQAPNGLAAFLSIYDLLWISRNWVQQAANQFWPTATMWSPSLIYYQSYTVYNLMVILPFTRPKWHAQGLIIFGLGSYWMESWGWYSATGLLLADLSVNPTLRTMLEDGIKFTDSITIPSFIPAVALTILGLVQKYLWVAAFPRHINDELTLHPTLHTSDSDTTTSFDKSQPYARLDDWLVVVGVLLLIELFQPLQKALSTRALTYLGDLSLSKSFMLKTPVERNG